jgi:glutathione S-transferase
VYELIIGNKNYSSWSLRPWVLMKSLGIPFEETLRQFEPVSSWGAFREFSPTGRVPLLKDGDVSVWESIAIVEYLAERHAGVWPSDSVARAWARSAAAEMHAGFSTLRNICTMNCGIRVVLKETPKALQEDIARFTELWNDGLKRFGGPFLAGDQFTAVDAFYAPVAFRVQTYGLVLDPASQEYVDLLLRQPAMQEWYEAGLKETFREPVHEEEARAAGTWTADFRATA